MATELIWKFREEIHALRLPGFEASAVGLEIISLNLGDQHGAPLRFLRPCFFTQLAITLELGGHRLV